MNYYYNLMRLPWITGTGKICVCYFIVIIDNFEFIRLLIYDMPVEVKQVSKYYGSQAAVKDLTFSLKKGEILGFLGPNGAGKTTTMKMISGYLLPTSGSITLDHYNIYDDSLMIRKQIGYLPEHNPLYLDMYVKEFLMMMCRIHHIPVRERKKRRAEIIEMTGVELSKGYRQRVGLGQALLHDPAVLILDEPTTGLDPNQIVDIRNLIRNLGREKSIIFSSHILPEVESIADRIIIIHKGQMVADAVVQDMSSAMQQEALITVEFEQPGFDATAIESLEGVIEIVSLSPRQFEVKTTLDTDIRPQIFHESVRQKHVILTLQQEVYTLEDTFRTLTQT